MEDTGVRGASNIFVPGREMNTHKKKNQQSYSFCLAQHSLLPCFPIRGSFRFSFPLSLPLSWLTFPFCVSYALFFIRASIFVPSLVFYVLCPIYSSSLGFSCAKNEISIGHTHWAPIAAILNVQNRCNKTIHSMLENMLLSEIVHDICHRTQTWVGRRLLRFISFSVHALNVVKFVYAICIHQIEF